MSRLVGVETHVAEAEWERVVRDAPGASFLHTPAYGRAAHEAFPNTTPSARLYTFDDGVEALLPGVVQTALKGAVRVFTSVPPSDYGGLLAATRLGADHVEAIAADLMQAGFGMVSVYESPLALQPALPGFEPTYDFTHVLDVTGGLDGLMRAITHSQTRQSMNRALKSEVRVESRSDETAVDEFYRLYLMSVERWGEKATWVRPVEYLKALLRHGRGSVLIRMAYLGDSAIGGQVDYTHGDVSVTGWRAFDYEHRALYPNLLTLRLAIEEGYERGVRVHDLGPSAGLEGLEISKDRCGGARLGFRVWVWESAAHRLYRTGRRGLDRTQAAVRAATTR